MLSFVYARCSIVDRRELWQQLHVLSQIEMPCWLIWIDFNTLLYANERDPTLLRYRSIDDFHEAISLAKQIDAMLVSLVSSWCNNQ